MHTFATKGYMPCAARNEMHTVLNVVLKANNSRYNAKLRTGLDVLLNVTFLLIKKLNVVDITTAITFEYVSASPNTALNT